MSGSAGQTALHEALPGTRLVMYICLPASLGEAADHSLASTQQYNAAAGWEEVETFPARAAPFESHAVHGGWPNALAAVEQGKAAGIETPLLAMVGHPEEDRANRAAWQARTGALITTPWAVVDAAGATVARRLAT